MRRLLNVLSLTCVILAVLTVGLWITSHLTGLHVGRVQVETDPFGTTAEMRDGWFLQRGRLTFAFGTRMHWHEQGPRPQQKREERQGVFLGDFRPWTNDHRFVLGFGARRGDDWDQVTMPPLAGESLVVAMPIAWWLLLFLAAPAWRSAGRRLRMSAGSTLACLLMTWGLLVAFAAIAIPLPGLGGLILLYLGILVTWSIGRYGIGAWLAFRKHARAGRCRVCGYDLRATPDPDGPLLDRCPECGTYTRPLA